MALVLLCIAGGGYWVYASSTYVPPAPEAAAAEIAVPPEAKTLSLNSPELSEGMQKVLDQQAGPRAESYRRPSSESDSYESLDPETQIIEAREKITEIEIRISALGDSADISEFRVLTRDLHRERSRVEELELQLRGRK
ncbi:MAG: hypothetical protein EOP11_04555 [Proteobacteria bacterium]|nr:MAG: hypothetical protein EOP11_04555 [Pseudomonadota bacterium]